VANRWIKALGLAGVLGLAAGGAVVARQERQRRAYSAEEIRDRLQQRYAEIGDQARDEAAEAWRGRRGRREGLGTPDPEQPPAP
jgi:hypothetical protein